MAKVFLINRKINEDRTVRVHCHLIKDDPTLLPQSYVKATIETGNNSVTALPNDAIVSNEGKDYIFVVKEIQQHKAGDEGKHFEFMIIQVKKGISEGNFTEVVLPENFDIKQQVVLKGAYPLLSQMKGGGEEE